MKKIIIGVLFLAVVAGAGYLLLGDALLSRQAEAEEVQPVVEAQGQVVAEARVVPIRHSALSMGTGGVVLETTVVEGDQVTAGQTLVRLNAASQEAAVAQAEAGLQQAQAGLDELKAGPRPQEIAAARAAVESAQAELAKINQSAQPEEIGAAEASLAAAQASLDKVLEGPDEDEITIAAAGLQASSVALKQAQWAYDEVAYASDVGASPEAATLEQATLDYEAALARYNMAVRGPTTADVAGAKAQLAQAQAQLDLLRRGPGEAEVATVDAEIRRAQAQLDLVQAGARPEVIQAAEAEVAAAQAVLEAARVSLAETELQAPFDGVVAELAAEKGEWVDPGVVVVQLADVSAWQIETEDLTELSVVEIEEGAPVTISVDAIPDLELEGRVTRIKPLGEDRYGDITYTVLIEPEEQNERLRWNMTTDVRIAPGGTQSLASQH